MLIVAIVGGIIGFLILALLLMSVILYILVRRSVEKRHAKKYAYERESKCSATHSRSSVVASDSPEVPRFLQMMLMSRRNYRKWNRLFGELLRDLSRR